MRKPAFTLIEILAVAMIIGILAITMAVRFQGAQGNASYNAQTDSVVSFLQKARGMSFNSVFVNNAEALDHYLLEISEDTLTLTAVGEGSETEPIDTLELEEGFSIALDEYYTENTISLYYFPPYGTLCFKPYLSECDDSPDWSDADINMVYLSLVGEDPEYEALISISQHGGFAEEIEVEDDEEETDPGEEEPPEL